MPLNGKLIKKYVKPENQEYKFLSWITKKTISEVKVEVTCRANVRDCILLFRNTYKKRTSELTDREVLILFVNAYGADHG